MAAVIATAEWLHAPASPWAVTAALLALLAAAASLLHWRRVPARLLAVTLVLLAVELLATARQLYLNATDWPAQREARITAYGERVGGELRSALRATSRLADRGVDAATRTQEGAFEELAAAVPAGGVELGVAILDSSGAPWAWAGRHRLVPEAGGDSIDARTSGYYVVLETRRHSEGRIVVASVLIWADSAVPDRSRSVAERFRRATEVGLHVYPPGAAPEHNPDIFDYFEPTTAGPRQLFSVQPVPPTQDEARERVFTRSGRTLLLLIALSILPALLLAGAPAQRYLLLIAPLWVAARAPGDALLGLGNVFSPSTFFDPLLGPLSSSSAALALTGAVLAMLALRLWYRSMPRAPALRLAGLLMAALALAIVWRFAQRVTPPSRGAGIALWLVWQGAIVIAGATAAIMGRALAGHVSARWPAVAGAVIAGLVSAAALWTWSPSQDWSVTLPLLFLLPLFLTMLARSGTAALAGIGTTLGLLASLLVWRADVLSRMAMAERDVGNLGTDADPFVQPLLSRFARRIMAVPPPSSAAELYTLWQSSALEAEGYPVQLALWDSAGAPGAELPLDSLAIPSALLGALARGLPDSVGALELRAVPAVPGIHQVLALRRAPGLAITVAIGPRSALIAPDRLGRLLVPSSERALPYRLVLGSPAAHASTDPLSWRRRGWTLQASRAVSLPGGPREVQASVLLLGAAPAVVRGALIAVFDVVLLLLIWASGVALSGTWAASPGWRRLGRSFRLRVALALALFFVLPTVAFSLWAFSHFASEAERGRDLLIRQTLRDAAQGAGSILRTPGAPLDASLRGLSERVDADLALYRGGLLVATSAPILRDLGVVGPLMDPDAFRAMAMRGELEVAQAGLIPSLAERVGYRVIEFGPPSGVGVLVTPQAGGDVDPGRQQRELALILLLGMSLGIAAAISGAGVVARALTRPVADLRRSALALGQGKRAPLPDVSPPVEFEPVFGAFQRMASDVHASQAALEQARRRTAAVLATVTTGVVAFDSSGQVMIANARARALTRSPLREGTPLAHAFEGDWAAVRSEIEQYVDAPLPGGEAREFTVGEQRIAIAMAPLGSELNGVVLALNDVTELSRAERVLAWGEMARQVAHEIKNPLTPMRLGIQHLRRVHADRREDFDRTLSETAERILSEIDRLDTIARAFSRFAAPAGDTLPVERVDLAAIAADVVQLYRLTADGVQVRLQAAGPAWGGARRDEVREVLVNLLENAREAGARQIEVRVAGNAFAVEDDGTGMSADTASRIFEPRFSTNTSGSGLGLAIVRRLVESWGGSVAVESEPGRGTVVRVTAGALSA
ncbi:MAG TPA: ATP-binding protein [Gemmatimonadales bacterium]|nr:ATP-binding protein [Gemmatimonadales bacterium]